MPTGQVHPDSGEGAAGLVAVLDTDSARGARIAATLRQPGVDAIVPDDPHRFLARLSDSMPDVIVASAGEIGDDALDRLSRVDIAPPVILTHGPGDIPTVVEAMRRGAFDYLARPIDPTELHNRVSEGIAASRRRRQTMERRVAAEERVAGLDARMRLLAEQIMLGHSNSEIARLWGVSERTVASHRASLMRSAGALNTAHLVRILMEGGMTPPGRDAESSSASNGAR